CFFFQAEDGIRDFHVTGVQTCALPIYCRDCPSFKQSAPSSSFKLQIYKFAIYFYLISKLKPYSELIPSQNRSKLNLSYLLSKCALCLKHVVNYLKKKRSRSPSLKERVLGI